MNKVLAFTLLFFFISGSFVTAIDPVSALWLVADSWNTKTSMSQARSGLGVVAVDGKIYAIGGISGIDIMPDNNGGFLYCTEYTGINEAYDTKTDTWTTLKPMPTPRAFFTTFVYQSKIYCIGGFSNCTIDDMGLISYVACRITEVYNTTTDIWIQKTSIPKEPYTQYVNMVDYMILAATFDEILFSGLFSSGAQGAIMYNPKTDVWHQIANSPYGIFYGSAIATTGVYTPQKIYAIGITQNGVYDPVNDTWSTIDALPTIHKGFWCSSC